MEDDNKVQSKMMDTPEDWYNWLFGFGMDCDVEHIKNNKSGMARAFQALLPGKTITFVECVDFYIHAETGTVLPEATILSKAKLMHLETRRIKILCDFNPEDFKGEYVYIMDWSVGPNNSVYLRCAEYTMPARKTMTFTIDVDVINKFSTIADKMAINKSKFVENMLKEFIQKNS